MKRLFLFIVVLAVLNQLFSGGNTSKKIVSVAQALTPAVFFSWSEIPEDTAISITDTVIEFAGLDNSNFSLVTEAMAAENDIKSKSDFDLFTERIREQISYCTRSTFKNIKKNKPKDVNEVSINRLIAACLRENGIRDNAYSYSELMRVNDLRQKNL